MYDSNGVEALFLDTKYPAAAFAESLLTALVSAGVCKGVGQCGRALRAETNILTSHTLTLFAHNGGFIKRYHSNGITKPCRLARYKRAEFCNYYSIILNFISDKCFNSCC